MPAGLPRRSASATGPWTLFGWTQQLRADDGHYCTGIVYPEMVHFPGDERSTYTAASIVLAADALGEPTRASALFADPDSVLPPLVLDRLDDAVDSGTERD